MDIQRGGWYDVVSRVRGEGEDWHRYAWHDRKAWWQQEQGILAYLILFGMEKQPDYLRLARESSAFYNAWFLDHDAGGVYFNVLANGMPYMMGTERQKGSHSMAGYHSFELCYLAAVYTNLLITKEHLDLHFKPAADADRTLRVAPDLLPAGTIRIESVTLDGQAHEDFDAEKLTVSLPDTNSAIKVVVRLIPTEGMEHFSISLSDRQMILSGELDPRAVAYFRTKLTEALTADSTELTLDMSDLRSMCKPAVRALVFERGKMAPDGQLTVSGANDEIKALFSADELSEEIILV
jgi:anti-anti-sigma regulatory factor